MIDAGMNLQVPSYPYLTRATYHLMEPPVCSFEPTHSLVKSIRHQEGARMERECVCVRIACAMYEFVMCQFMLSHQPIRCGERRWLPWNKKPSFGSLYWPCD